MEKTEDKLIPDDIEDQKILLEENLKALNEGKDSSEPEEGHPDFDDYYEVKDEEPDMKLEKGQTVEQVENESEDYF